MQISVPDNKLRTTLQDDKLIVRHYGKDMAKKIRLRLNSLAAADSLAVFHPPKSGPERTHELIGDLAGWLSMDLKHPFRLLFSPTDEVPKDKFATELERWEAITSIAIRGIEDTHD
jgi:plasmid maintenance system killer protein